MRCVRRADDYLCGLWAAFPGCEPAFQRVQPDGRLLAGMRPHKRISRNHHITSKQAPGPLIGVCTTRICKLVKLLTSGIIIPPVCSRADRAIQSKAVNCCER